MEKNPKVSIIIPVYNGENYLKNAIDSALAQTYKNIEIIVVNDGSRDNTEKIIKSYGNKIKYIKKENGGVSTALNLAIKNMSGEYFSWLSHDDIIKENKIQTQINFLQSYSESNIILYSDFDLIDEKNNVTGNVIKDHNELINKPEYALLMGAINGITLIIPKRAFDDCGIFDEKLYCTQDYDMWYRMFEKYKFIHQKEILASSRIHENQETNRNPKVLSEGNELWIKLIENIDKNTKIRLEGSEYKFYLKMYNFLKNSQYYSTVNYLKKKLKNLKEDIDYNPKDFKNSLSFSVFLHKIKTVFKLFKNNPKKLLIVLKTKLNINK